MGKKTLLVHKVSRIMTVKIIRHICEGQKKLSMFKIEVKFSFLRPWIRIYIGLFSFLSTP